MPRVTRARRRRLLLLAAVILPGLVISALGIHYVSRQRKAMELRLQENFETSLTRIRNAVEQRLDTALRDVFERVGEPGALPSDNDPAALQTLLKTILLEHPVVKHPFLLDTGGGYVFPFSKDPQSLKQAVLTGADASAPAHIKKTGPHYRLYKEAEDLEFRERNFSQAVVRYLRFLSAVKQIGVKQIGVRRSGVTHPAPVILHAVARCYTKMNRFPQAAAYLEELRTRHAAALKKDPPLYYRVLLLSARVYARMNRRNAALTLYLQLYDETLQYEMSNKSDIFGYFKNEALDYLNRHLGKDDRLRRQFDQAREREGIGRLSTLEINLRWRYFDPDDAAPVTTGSNRREEETFAFAKLREFYLPNDEKSRFYKMVKDLELRARPGAAAPGVKYITGARMKTKPGIAYAAVGTGSAGSGAPSLVFGFMISIDYIRTRLLPGVSKEHLTEKELTVSLVQTGRTRYAVGPRFPLVRLPFQTLLNSHTLVLTALRDRFIEHRVKREMVLNVTLIGVIVSMLFLGTWLFYKYMSREAELVQLKADFVDSASHTLKTPLTRIRMLAEKLELGWVKEEKKQSYFRTIIRETDRMTEMITNMLDFSKVEAGRKQYEMQNADIVAHTATVLHGMSVDIREMGFHLKLDLDPDIPFFYFDADALQLILMNLVQNAMKYSREEKYIAVRLVREGEEVVLSVTDRGMGIAPDRQERIFDKFYRAPDGHISVLEGSGLGLYLVRHAVQAHAGRISVTSRPGEGSTFEIRLPLEKRKRKNE